MDAREIARRVVPGRLDTRAAREREQPVAPSGPTASVQFRAATRTLQTVFGDVSARRLYWHDRRHIPLPPADAALNLPPKRYSLTVRRLVVEGVTTRSFDVTLAELRRQGIAVPKRQAQQFVV